MFVQQFSALKALSFRGQDAKIHILALKCNIQYYSPCFRAVLKWLTMKEQASVLIGVEQLSRLKWYTSKQGAWFKQARGVNSNLHWLDLGLVTVIGPHSSNVGGPVRRKLRFMRPNLFNTDGRHRWPSDGHRLVEWITLVAWIRVSVRLSERTLSLVFRTLIWAPGPSPTRSPASLSPGPGPVPGWRYRESSWLSLSESCAALSESRLAAALHSRVPVAF